MSPTLPLDQVLQGDCRQVLGSLPPRSIDLIFADPPYNLQLRGSLYRPNMSQVDAVDDHWDQFESFEAYDAFTRDWLAACQRLLSPKGTLWVIGSYHNIHRVGKILMDLGYWILNDVCWVKSNPMPNFRGVRFTNAHETLIWAKASQNQKSYTFHYRVMKALNGNKQMRSDWHIPLCTGHERLKLNGDKAHTTQKPEALLERVILSCSSRGNVVLDPFFGTGTTGAVCKRYGRHFIGIENDPAYLEMARNRIAAVETVPPLDAELSGMTPLPPRMAFSRLLEAGLLEPGQELRFGAKGPSAIIQVDGKLQMGDALGSIHRIGSLAGGTPACNGWAHWYYHDLETDQYLPVDELRTRLRSREASGEGSRESAYG